MKKLVSINDRKLFGGPTDEFMQLHPIKYHWLWNAYQKASSNHWQPMEIPLGLDIEQWRYPEKYAITPEDKKMVKYALAFFAVADSLVADNILLNFYRQATAPELRMFLLRQSYEEAIHTHAYQYIIESLEIDATEIFSMHLQISEIYNKMKFAELQSHSLEDQLLIYYGVMEGVFFYAMFAILMSMANRGVFPGIAKQFEYIMRDEALHFSTGIEIYKTHTKEGNIHCTHSYIRDLFNEAYDVESSFIDEAVQNEEFQIQLHYYVRWVINNRISYLNISHSKVENPFPWMAQLSDIPKMENFFETTVTAYQTGGSLEW